MIVVVDSSVLVALAGIGRFALLEQIFGEILIPQAVYDEVTVDQSPASQEVSGADWIHTVRVKDRLAVEVLLDEMHLGEAEVIVLAHEARAQLVAMDDMRGRRKLDALGIRKIGTLGILLSALRQGMIPALKPEIDALLHMGFNLSQSVIDMFLTQEGE